MPATLVFCFLGIILFILGEKKGKKELKAIALIMLMLVLIYWLMFLVSNRTS